MYIYIYIYIYNIAAGDDRELQLGDVGALAVPILAPAQEPPLAGHGRRVMPIIIVYEFMPYYIRLHYIM